MNGPKPDEILNTYWSQIQGFEENVRSVEGAIKLITRIEDLVDHIYHIEHPTRPPVIDQYTELETLLFEYKTIAWLSTRKWVDQLQYEPSGIDPEGKRIDIKFKHTHNGEDYFVELKSSHPRGVASRVPREHFSADTLIVNSLAYSWMSSFRGHLLDYLYETEKKAENYAVPFRLVLCIDGNFYADDDEIQKAWSFYKDGSYRPDDAFGSMMEHHCDVNQINFSRRIDMLWSLPFDQHSFFFSGIEAPIFLGLENERAEYEHF